jgi:hypothetical protein
MREACSLIWTALVGLFRTRASLVAEILVLRHQINIQRRHLPKRQTFRIMDRLIFAGLYRLAPNVLNALAILKPETVLKWHRAGFRSYWRWKSRRHAGRPIVPLAVRKLIREMSIANPLWGAPRIHGELLKLGIDVGQTSVAKYMVKRRGPPSQGWKTFLHNHADGIAAMDLFVVPTISFRLLYGLLIMGHGRRQIFVVWRHSASDRRMDRKSGHGSMRLGTSSPLSDPRSGRCLWRGLHPKTSIDGHSRSTHVATLAMAKRICRKANRFDPTGLS